MPTLEQSAGDTAAKKKKPTTQQSVFPTLHPFAMPDFLLSPFHYLAS